MSKMSPLQLAQKLKLPEITIEALRNYKLDENVATRLKAAFQEGPEVFEAEVRKEPDADLMVLALYMKWGMDTHYMYAIRGMLWDIFFDTFEDLRLWAEAFTAETGKPGLKHWAWCAKAIKMKVFRLDRLEFEPDVLQEDLKVGETTYAAGTKVLNVHIPAGEKMTPEAVEESLSQALPFFRMYYRQEYELLRCCSWLLSPALEELLDENSNIRQFKNRFEIYETRPYRQAEERVFGKIQDDPADYPEETSLQRAMKQYLISGGKVDMGCGVILCKDIQEIY